MKIVLISGLKRSGKDHIGKLLHQELELLGKSAKILSFATPLKQVVANTFGITLEALEEYKNAEDKVLCHIDDTESRHNLHTISIRKILQNFGTEAMKPVFGTNVWGNLLHEAAISSDTDYIIVPDYRFDAEYKYLKDQKHEILTVHIEGSIKVSNDSHSSEALPTVKPDFIIDNSEKSPIIILDVKSLARSL